MRKNKGFSLVELIIVIAIMAILVGVMAPQLIKYIEKANVSADKQIADTVHTACVTAASDPDVVTATNPGVPTTSTNASAQMGSATPFGSEFSSILGATTIALKSSGVKGSGANDVSILTSDGVHFVVSIAGSSASIAVGP